MSSSALYTVIDLALLIVVVIAAIVSARGFHRARLSADGIRRSGRNGLAKNAVRRYLRTEGVLLAVQVLFVLMGLARLLPFAPWIHEALGGARVLCAVLIAWRCHKDFDDREKATHYYEAAKKIEAIGESK